MDDNEDNGNGGEFVDLAADGAEAGEAAAAPAAGAGANPESVTLAATLDTIKAAKSELVVSEGRVYLKQQNSAQMTYSSFMSVDWNPDKSNLVSRCLFRLADGRYVPVNGVLPAQRPHPTSTRFILQCLRAGQDD